MKKNSLAKTLVWILMGLLFVGLGGFGAVNFTGTARDLALVGDKTVTISEYGRALQNELRRLSQQTGQTISFEQAKSAGLDAQILSQLIRARRLEDEAARLGLSMGDARLQDQLMSIGAFHGGDGQFDAQTYRSTLENAGLTARDFEAGLRDEAGASILQGAVLAGLSMPDVYAQTIAQYAGEARGFTWAELNADDLNIAPGSPNDADLQAFHAQNAARYTQAETKMITYIAALPNDMVDDITLDDGLLQDEYARRLDEFVQPERRILDRLAFANEDEARAALADITAGRTSFDALVTDRGVSLDDVAMDPVTLAELGTGGEAVFAAELDQVVGPIETALGPALMRVTVILDAVEIAFDEAQDALRADLAMDAARRQIDVLAQDMEDQLAAGATLDELATLMNLPLAQLAWDGAADDDIAAYPAFRQAADAAAQGDFPETMRLSDGGLFALRVDDVTPAQLQPLADIRDTVAADWAAAEVTNLLDAKAQEIVPVLSGGGLFTAQGLAAQKQDPVARGGFVEAIPASLIEAVFTLETGGVLAHRDQDRVFVARLNEVQPADLADPDMQALIGSIRSQTNGALAQDMLQALMIDIQSRIDVSIDEQAINAVHAQLP
jgi:peptidyl-prolyl cis-trans isomerase D